MDVIKKQTKLKRFGLLWRIDQKSRVVCPASLIRYENLPGRRTSLANCSYIIRIIFLVAVYLSLSI